MAGIEPISTAATAVVDIGAKIATTINTINDVNTRRKFEQNLAALTNDQQKALNEALMNANSESQRLAILGNVLGGSTQARINAIANIQASLLTEKEKTKKIVTVSIIFGVVVIGAILLTLRNK